jgi:hypothetical protein
MPSTLLNKRWEGIARMTAMTTCSDGQRAGAAAWVEAGLTLGDTVVDLGRRDASLLGQLVRQPQHGKHGQADVVLLGGVVRVGRSGRCQRSDEAAWRRRARAGRSVAARETEEDLEDVVHLRQVLLDEPPALLGASSRRIGRPAVERVLDRRRQRSLPSESGEPSAPERRLLHGQLRLEGTHRFRVEDFKLAAPA